MGTVPPVPTGKPPIGRTMPVVLVLTGAVVLIGASTAYNAMSGSHKKEAAKSNLQSRPATADTQQVSGFEKQQALIQKNDAQNAQLQQAVAALQAQEQSMQQAQGQAIPPPEADAAAPMTPAQSAAIYGTSPNAPRQTSGRSEAHAQAKQNAAEREKRRLDALNSDTVAVDFQTHETRGEGQTPSVSGPTVTGQAVEIGQSVTANDLAEGDASPKPVDEQVTNAMAAYDFDQYGGKLYRVFEGTVLEGVITNHVDGGMAGPVLLMLTTDYYSHDRQNLLLPQGTRLIGSVTASRQPATAQARRCLPPCGLSGWLLNRHRQVPRPRSDRDHRLGNQGRPRLSASIRRCCGHRWPGRTRADRQQRERADHQ